MKRVFFGALVSVMLLAGCVSNAGNEPVLQEAAAAESVEAISFLGKPLLAADKGTSLDAKNLFQALIVEGKLTEADFMAVGARLAGAGQYQDAITAYSEGLHLHPDSYKLRRHRAHRYMTTRQLEKAYDDLSVAVQLVAHVPKSDYEYKDGKPNGTYQHWINYHLGVYFYLEQDFDKATFHFDQCLKTAETNDMLIGVVDWLYNAHRKNGNDEAALAALDLIAPDIEADITYPYYKRVMFYKGEMSKSDILDPTKTSDAWNARDTTIAYALANWFEYNEDEESAIALRRKVLATPFWNIWAYIAAEKEEDYFLNR